MGYFFGLIYHAFTHPQKLVTWYQGKLFVLLFFIFKCEWRGQLCRNPFHYPIKCDNRSKNHCIFLGEGNFMHLSPKLVTIIALLWSSVPIGECNIKTWEHASSLGECNVHVEFLMRSHLGTWWFPNMGSDVPMWGQDILTREHVFPLRNVMFQVRNVRFPMQSWLAYRHYVIAKLAWVSQMWIYVMVLQ